MIAINVKCEKAHAYPFTPGTWSGRVQSMGILLFIPIILALVFVTVARNGFRYPRFGRWLDAQLHRAFPRLGHVFVEEENREGE
jgi:hypothetical protein